MRRTISDKEVWFTRSRRGAMEGADPYGGGFAGVRDFSKSTWELKNVSRLSDELVIRTVQKNNIL